MSLSLAARPIRPLQPLLHQCQTPLVFFLLSVTFSENPEGPIWSLSGRAEGGRKLGRSPLFGSGSLGLQPSPQQLSFKWQGKVLLIRPRGKARVAYKGSTESPLSGRDEESCPLAALCFSLCACLFSHYH